MIAAIRIAAVLLAAPWLAAAAPFDGVYSGTQTQEATGPACSASSRRIVFTVDQGRIAVRSHHVSRVLSGTVAADGRVAMQDADGRRTLTGRIAGPTLTAQEVAQISKKHRARNTVDEPGACTSRIEATLR